MSLKCFIYSHKKDGLSLDWLDEVAQLAEQPVLAVLLAHDACHYVGHHVAENGVALRLLDAASSLKIVYGYLPETIN